MNLVVGATGQLGGVVVEKLLARGLPVRAFVRRSSDYVHLDGAGVELAFGDLRDRASVDAACLDVSAVIATANAAVPREPGDSFKSVDDQGNANLIAAAKHADVSQFIFMSVVSHPDYNRMPLPSTKRVTEQRLRDCGIVYTIFQADAFMDVIFPLMGSDIPLRGTQSATVTRPFWFSQRFFASVKDQIATSGRVNVVGDGTQRRTYICIDDAAEFLVAAIGHSRARNATFEIGGPEALSQNELLALWERVLGKPLHAKRGPATVFKIAHREARR